MARAMWRRGVGLRCWRAPATPTLQADQTGVARAQDRSCHEDGCGSGQVSEVKVLSTREHWAVSGHVAVVTVGCSCIKWGAGRLQCPGQPTEVTRPGSSVWGRVSLGWPGHRGTRAT